MVAVGEGGAVRRRSSAPAADGGRHPVGPRPGGGESPGRNGDESPGRNSSAPGGRPPISLPL